MADSASAMPGGSVPSVASTSSVTEMSIQEKGDDYVVILKMDDSYMRTPAGILRFVQLLVSLIGMICVLSSGTTHAGYLMIPHNIYLRIFIFITVCGIFSSLIRILLQISSLVEMLPVNWDLYDIVTCSLLAGVYLMGSCLLAHAVHLYTDTQPPVPDWTQEQLIVAIVLGYIGTVFYAASAALAYHSWKGLSQFIPRRFSSRSSRSSPQPSQSSQAPESDANPIV